MKLCLFLALFTSTSSVSTERKQKLWSVQATFDGYFEGTFYFVDIEGTCYEFEEMEPQAKEKYDLTDGTCEGKRFTVVYRVETGRYEDESGEEHEFYENIIVDLEIVG